MCHDDVIDHHIALASKNDIERLRDFLKAIEDRLGSQKFGDFLCYIHGMKLEFAAILIQASRLQVLFDNQP